MENIRDFSIKQNSYAQIISLLSKNVAVWNKISKFQQAFDRLVSNQKKAEELLVLFTKDLTTLDKAKNDKRKELEDSTLKVVRIMQIFAHDKKKSKLQRALFNINATYIQNCPDMELIKIAKKNFLIANKFG